MIGRLGLGGVELGPEPLDVVAGLGRRALTRRGSNGRLPRPVAGGAAMMCSRIRGSISIEVLHQLVHEARDEFDRCDGLRVRHAGRPEDAHDADCPPDPPVRARISETSCISRGLFSWPMKI